MQNIFKFGESLEDPNAEFNAYQARIEQNFENIRNGLPAENMQDTEEYENLVKRVASIFNNNQPTNAPTDAVLLGEEFEFPIAMILVTLSVLTIGMMVVYFWLLRRE